MSPGHAETFLRDVAPILNKAGCTSGPCHGAAKGKNGFKLSLRGEDPAWDYAALTRDGLGRRTDPLRPDASWSPHTTPAALTSRPGRSIIRDRTGASRAPCGRHTIGFADP